jgi:hypothetical protein
MPTAVKPTQRDLIASLGSTCCPACGRAKKRAMSFCSNCYYSLSSTLRKRLYARIGSGYEGAFASALEVLGKSFIAAPAEHPRPAGPIKDVDHIDKTTGEYFTDGRRAWEKGLVDAEAFRDLFPPACYERWEIGGSVRRKSTSGVKDVDHIVIPRIGEMDVGSSLFAMPERVNLLWFHLDALVKGNHVTKHAYGTNEAGAPKHRWGDKHRGVDFRGFNHEVRVADQHNWGSALAIWTGPGEFSRALVTGLQRNGYCNHKGYVFNKKACQCQCGWSGTFSDLRRCDIGTEAEWTDGTGAPVVCPTCGRGDRLVFERISVPAEQDYLKLCGYDWVRPEDRGTE